MASYEKPEQEEESRLMRAFETLKDVFIAAEEEYQNAVAEFGEDKNPEAVKGKEKLADFHADCIANYIEIVKKMDVVHEKTILTDEQEMALHKYLSYFEFLKDNAAGTKAS